MTFCCSTVEIIVQKLVRFQSILVPKSCECRENEIAIVSPLASKGSSLETMVRLDPRGAINKERPNITEALQVEKKSYVTSPLCVFLLKCAPTELHAQPGTFASRVTLTALVPLRVQQPREAQTNPVMRHSVR